MYLPKSSFHEAVNPLRWSDHLSSFHPRPMTLKSRTLCCVRAIVPVRIRMRTVAEIAAQAFFGTSNDAERLALLFQLCSQSLPHGSCGSKICVIHILLLSLPM